MTSGDIARHANIFGQCAFILVSAQVVVPGAERRQQREHVVNHGLARLITARLNNHHRDVRQAAELKDRIKQ